MKAVPGREVHCRVELLFEKQLDPDEVEGVEAAFEIIVDEKVDVALLSGLVAGDRAEQIERGGAKGADGVLVLQQPFYRLALSHARSSTASGPVFHAANISLAARSAFTLR